MRTSRLATALVALLAIAPATARGPETFEYVADRVEIDGNVFGPHDGVPDLVDEFDDGALAPNWAVSSGTASESDGLLRLHSPGLTSG
jgi:hypothetical protein